MRHMCAAGVASRHDNYYHSHKWKIYLFFYFTKEDKELFLDVIQYIN